MTLTPFELEFHNPDVLTCMANLSSDEVFTPPDLANEMLDALEQRWSSENQGENIWSNSKVRFLDPSAKSGVFLREIVKRLISGLDVKIPDLTERVNHILLNQVFGIALTELTGLISRRTLYCSKDATGIHSIARAFKDPKGNIWQQRVEHVWETGRCQFCGVNENEYARSTELESHAYAFIHTSNIKNKIHELFGDEMRFDVIIGNPPYQLNVGNTSGNSSKARAIYHEFVAQAMKLEPRYISMVIPSRWMTRSTEGIPESWIDDFIDDKRIRVLHDFVDSKLCFPGVEITGGVCYFLWDRDSEGKCEYFLHTGLGTENTYKSYDYLNAKGIGIVIRDINAMSILNKIENVEGQWWSIPEKSFTSLVSPKDFFTNKSNLTSSWKEFSIKKDAAHNIKYYLNKGMHKTPFAWIELSDIPKNQDSVKLHKVYIPAARGTSNEEDNLVLGRPFYGEPDSVCSQTYLVIGYDSSKHKLTKTECENIISYISTRFFRYLVSLKKKTQNGPRNVYQFVPIQDFSEPWNDEKLFEKYGLNESEVEWIETMIRPFDTGASVE